MLDLITKEFYSQEALTSRIELEVLQVVVYDPVEPYSQLQGHGAQVVALQPRVDLVHHRVQVRHHR